MRWLPPKSPPNFTKETRGEIVEFLEKAKQSGKLAATSMHYDFLLDSEECHEWETDCAHANVDSLVGCLEGSGGGEVAAEVPR